ncbi:hypothetical protein [Paenibacillus sp. NPDC055715]
MKRKRESSTRKKYGTLIFWPTRETEANRAEAVLQSFDGTMLTYKMRSMGSYSGRSLSMSCSNDVAQTCYSFLCPIFSSISSAKTTGGMADSDPACSSQPWF